MHCYTSQQRDFLSRNKEVPRKKLAPLFNAKFGTNLSHQNIVAYMVRHQLKMTNGSSEGQFKNCHVPHNKGKRGKRNSIKTEFKKGNTPANKMPIGTLKKFDCEGGYWKIKVSDIPNNGRGNWRYAHHLVWESHNGKIPDGNVIAYIDRNPDNWHNINNLICLSRNQLKIFNRELAAIDNSLIKEKVLLSQLIIKLDEMNKEKNG